MIRPRVSIGCLARSSLLLTGLFVSCANLFDDPVQCTTDADCTRFSAVCGTEGVCVTGNVVQPGNGDASTTTTTGPVNPSGSDASTTDASLLPLRCTTTTKATASIGTKLAPAADATARGEIATSTTLGCDKDWILDARVFVRPGATLTIEAGTTIRAKAGGAIVVTGGGRIVATGQRDAPIVFTTDAAAPAAGAWDGVYLLGRAAPADPPPYADDPELPWGGDLPEDDSGVLSFVRIEYASEGLVFAGVGSKTRVDSVEVRKTVANCFTFYGGKVDVKHLVCQSPGDDQFEFYLGYDGRAQFLFGQKTPAAPTFEAHGLLIDAAEPAIFNATFCGETPAPNGYGIVVRDGGTLALSGAVVSGWRAGIDLRGDPTSPGALTRSIFFGNDTDPAFDEDPADLDPDSDFFDDDNGFDEVEWFGTEVLANTFTDPKLVACFDATNPKPWPAVSLTANAPSPPADGFFDPAAKYIGAFKDATDPWMKGSWLRFSDK